MLSSPRTGCGKYIFPLFSSSEDLAACSSFRCNTFIPPTSFPRRQRFLASQLRPQDFNATEQLTKVKEIIQCSQNTWIPSGFPLPAFSLLKKRGWNEGRGLASPRCSPPQTLPSQLSSPMGIC